LTVTVTVWEIKPPDLLKSRKVHQNGVRF